MARATGWKDMRLHYVDFLTSVYGLYAGLKRTFSIPIFLKKTRINPRRQIFNHKDTVEFEYDTNEVGESETTIGDDTLYLMKFRQMCCIHRFVSEYAVDTEELRRPETALLFTTRGILNRITSAFCSQFIQHVRGRCCRVRA